MPGGRAETPAAPYGSPDRLGPPRPVTAAVLGGLSLVMVALTAWLAVKPGAQSAQTDVVQWFNHPPQPVAALFALANPLLRPVPLLVVAGVLVGWILVTAWRTSQRLEVLRALVIAVALSELLAQVLKRLADQPRPLEVVPGLDPHGYPISPHGNAYPSAHTAVTVAVVAALWPWTRWPWRVAGVAIAVLTACNRIYIAAHWPLDVIGGAAIGLLCGSVTWLVATRWPLHRVLDA